MIAASASGAAKGLVWSSPVVAGALIAVVGSITAVIVSGVMQRRLQRQIWRQQQRAQQDEWANNRALAQRAAEREACLRLDIAAGRAIWRLQRALKLSQQPGVRRRVIGRDWPRVLDQAIQEAADELGAPYSALRLSSTRAMREAAEDVMNAFALAGDLQVRGPVVGVLARPLLVRSVKQTEQMASAVHQARRALREALEAAETSTSPVPGCVGDGGQTEGRAQETGGLPNIDAGTVPEPTASRRAV